MLTDASTGTRTAQVTAVERTGPDHPDISTSHHNDCLVVVTKGELTAVIGAQSASVPAQAMIIIPAGVPHRIWNSSSIPVRYLDADVPPPVVYAKLASAE